MYVDKRANATDYFSYIFRNLLVSIYVAVNMQLSRSMMFML